jgi:hypothetical protein
VWREEKSAHTHTPRSAGYTHKQHNPRTITLNMRVCFVWCTSAPRQPEKKKKRDKRVNNMQSCFVNMQLKTNMKGKDMERRRGSERSSVVIRPAGEHPASEILH